MDNEIGLFDAKNKLSALVNSVREEGKEYVILHRGKPAARLVPLTAPTKIRYALSGEVYDPEKARAAIADMDRLRKEMGIKITHDEIVKLIRESREEQTLKTLRAAGILGENESLEEYDGSRS